MRKRDEGDIGKREFHVPLFRSPKAGAPLNADLPPWREKGQQVSVPPRCRPRAFCILLLQSLTCGISWSRQGRSTSSGDLVTQK